MSSTIRIGKTMSNGLKINKSKDTELGRWLSGDPYAMWDIIDATGKNIGYIEADYRLSNDRWTLLGYSARAFVRGEWKYADFDTMEGALRLDGGYFPSTRKAFAATKAWVASLQP